MPEPAHGGYQMEGTGTLGMGCMVWGRFRFAGTTVAGQIGAHHREPLVDQQGSNLPSDLTPLVR